MDVTLSGRSSVSGGRSATSTVAGSATAPQSLGGAAAASRVRAGLSSLCSTGFGAIPFFGGKSGATPRIGTHIHHWTLLDLMASFIATVEAHLPTKSLMSMYIASGALSQSVNTAVAIGLSGGRL